MFVFNKRMEIKKTELPQVLFDEIGGTYGITTYVIRITAGAGWNT